MNRLTSIALLAAFLPWTTPVEAQTAGCCTVTFRVTVPDSVGPVYLAGSLPALGPWRPDGLALRGSGRIRTARLTVPRGTTLEYKFTLGTWDREALTPEGAVPPNYRLQVNRDTSLTQSIAGFKKPLSEYLADWRGAGVKGTLVYWTDVKSQFLDPPRNVEIWLPPGYDQDPSRRYPVLYMHDGQNLFDPRIASTGVDWGVDEAVVRLVERGEIPPIIVVGVWNTGRRLQEYSPWHQGPDYARFLIEELMPRVNREFRTLAGPRHTAVMGSSMGGLISWYLVTRHADVFGACGCLSNSFMLSEAMLARFAPGTATTAAPDTAPYLLRDIQHGLAAPAGGRYWIDYGTAELDKRDLAIQDSVVRWLRRQGVREVELRSYAGARHTESAWRARLDDPLRFLFGRPTAGLNLGVPAWAREAVWYQIFPERFRNGDRSNDPRPADIAGFTDQPAPPNWRPTPWGWDWYRVEPWARDAGMDFYQSVQFRRYGGDLQGVLDRLDYLDSLGVTALYLNPVNDAPSLHKYDARNYRHADRNFGPDPDGDVTMMAEENPLDPGTWRWTSADSLLLKVIQEAHRRDMRVILDYSWNHTGIMFWAWQDVLRNQAASPYAGWYEVQRFDDPATPDTSEFAYQGWANVPWLPEWKKVGRPAGQTKGAIEGDLAPGVKRLIFAVTRRWMDPNGDGDPSDGVDGFRLDVADVVPLGYWRDYRRFVRSINAEAYLVGEIWWEHWPDRLYDPRPWLQDDVFDAVMHYHWFTPTRDFFLGRRTPRSYAAALDSLRAGISPAHQQALMNLAASHDTPRLGTALYNPGKYKYRNTPREDSTYRIDRPDQRTRATQRMLLVQQFTWIGAPHIWNGDEVGMWGADDPDDRKPMLWSDLRYDDETADPLGRRRPRNHATPDTALFRTYQQLIALRRDHLELWSEGEAHWILTDDARGLLVYDRTLEDQRAIVAFNVAEREQRIAIPARGTYRQAWPQPESPTIQATGTLRARLRPRSATVWIRE